MSQIKRIAFVLIPFFYGVFSTPLGLAAVTNPTPNKVFATDTTSVDFGWEPVAGASSYTLKLLYNDTEFVKKGGISGTSLTVTNTYPPGYYTVFIRSVNYLVGPGPWSTPVTFIVQRSMLPGSYSVFSAPPSVFRWTRTPNATRYKLKLAKYDKQTAKYVLMQTIWIPQPVSGIPKWNPPAGSIPFGKYRWSITDYNGNKIGYTSLASFQIKLPPPPEAYLVIDLSGGASASSYPVTYLTAVPEGGWPDEYKTTKMVLRKISAGTFKMGSPTNELGRGATETKHKVTLTTDFYIGVFEVTQRQWELVMGNRPSYFNNSTYYASRPVETVSYYEIRENPKNSAISPNWPQSTKAHVNSFIGKLRTKTSLKTIDLPTESQWEYACRAGTTTALNSGQNLTSTESCPNMAEVGRYYYNGGNVGDTSPSIDISKATAKVGSYLPNEWGIYDMHGNVWELCLDWYGPYPGTVLNPKGMISGSYRVIRGGSWIYPAGYCRSANRSNYLNPNYKSKHSGFRVASALP